MHSLRSEYPQLASQWDWEKNAGLTPDDVTPHSKRKVWWRCPKGHEWQAIVYSRTAGSGCPVCQNRKILPGYNDLATTHPHLAAQWHPTENGDLTPEKVGSGYDKKVTWRCSKGHVWRTSVSSRVQKSAGCPICANYIALAGYNDLATTYPSVAAQWHPTLNGSLTPQQVVAGSGRYVWWQCGLGHAWQAKVIDRTRIGRGCPYCANQKALEGFNDLATVYPEIAAQWDREKNGTLTPEQVLPHTNRSVWWRCPLGHSYRAAIDARTSKGGGCPYCSGHKVLAGFNDLATLEPEIAAQWHPTLNGPLKPSMVTTGSSKVVWWICSEGHAWKTAVAARGRRKYGCPYCSGRFKAARQENCGA